MLCELSSNVLSLLAEKQALASLGPAQELPGRALPFSAARECVSDGSWMVMLEFRFSDLERGLLQSPHLLDALFIFPFHY